MSHSKPHSQEVIENVYEIVEEIRLSRRERLFYQAVGFVGSIMFLTVMLFLFALLL